MFRRALLVGSIAALSLGLMGCTFYLDDDNSGYTYCDQTGCYECDDWGCWPIDNTDGWSCEINADCAPGCACVGGFCEEWGFCELDRDCPDGFVCDDRSSCVPEGSDACDADADCPLGSYCDEASGDCIDSTTCENSDGCDPGQECDDRGTCIPTPCSSHEDCIAGFYCDLDAGQCVESTDCSEGCATGFECDARDTCIPDDPNIFTCQGEVSCDGIPPACPLGSTPKIDQGCYTGACVPNAECPDGNPCASNTEEECLAADSCLPSYTGINCKDPGGNACTSGEANCTCESFRYAACEDAP